MKSTFRILFLARWELKKKDGRVPLCARISNKVSEVNNSYDAGSLSVTKNISGNMADMNKSFNFTVIFTAPTGDAVDSSISYTLAGNKQPAISFEDGKTELPVEFNLGNGETAVFTNLPAGVTYTVQENSEGYIASATGYDEVKEDASGNTLYVGSIAANDNDEIVVTNTKTSEVDTGIVLDSLPYILILAVAVGGILMFVLRKRNDDQF